MQQIPVLAFVLVGCTVGAQVSGNCAVAVVIRTAIDDRQGGVNLFCVCTAIPGKKAQTMHSNLILLLSRPCHHNQYCPGYYAWLTVPCCSLHHGRSGSPRHGWLLCSAPWAHDCTCIWFGVLRVVAHHACMFVYYSTVGHPCLFTGMPSHLPAMGCHHCCIQTRMSTKAMVSARCS